MSMKTLIALGANVNLRNGYNLTALDAAVMMHPQDKEMSQTLRDVGGVSNMPPQQAVGLQQMETGAEEQTMSRGEYFSSDSLKWTVIIIFYRPCFVGF